MNETKAKASEPGSVLLRRRRMIRRVFWIALAAAALVALVWLAYYLLRFQFYTGYRDAVERPRVYHGGRRAVFAA